MADHSGGQRKDGGAFVERDASLSKVDSVRKSTAKRRMSVEARISENKIITIGDYHTPLPEGWSYRESTKHKGKWYYISPSGQAQWIPPLVKTGKLYEWKLHLYIEFGAGKLGMNLKAVDALPDTLWTQFQVEIHTLRKLGNGHASPAELYNWSVKPDRRIYAGFRIVEIAGSSVAGFTYSEVIDKINRTPRPMVIGFCDCHRGLVGDPEEVDEVEEEDARKSVYQQRFNTIQSEHMKTMVLTELDKELWHVDLKRLGGLDIEFRAKGKRLRREIAKIEALNDQLKQLVKQQVAEKARCQALLDNVEAQQAQMSTQIEVRGHELAKKHQALLKSIDETTADNHRLVEQHARDTATLESLYEKLDRDESNNVLLMTKTQLYEEYGIKRSPFTLEDLHLLFFTLEEAAIVEEQEVQRGMAEVAQLKKHLDAMETGAPIPRTNDSSTRDLEMKLDWLRDQLQKTAQIIAKAEKKGKTKAVKGGYRRRNLLKIEYQLVQDELQAKVAQMGPQPTCPEEPSLLEERTEFIRQALRDVVQKIAKCPKDQQQIFLDRRAYLKKELEHVQNRSLELGLPLNTIRRSSLGEAPPRLSDQRPSAFEVRPSAFDDDDESLPSTPVYYPESLSPNLDEPLTPPMRTQTPLTVDQLPTLEDLAPPLTPPLNDGSITPPLELEPAVEVSWTTSTGPSIPPQVTQLEPEPAHVVDLDPVVPVSTFPVPEPTTKPVEVVAKPVVEQPPRVPAPKQSGPLTPHEFKSQLTSALTALSKQQQKQVPVEVQPDVESARPSSVYSLNDSEIGDTISVCSEESFTDQQLQPSKVDQLKADLRNVVAQISQASKDKNSSLATKLMKVRNQIKSELALAQDELQIDSLKHELREVVVQVAHATKLNDKAAVDHWMQRRQELKAQLKAAHDSLDKTTREAKPLDELKNELRAVVKDLQRPHLTKEEIEMFTAQKAELKTLIMAKQPKFVPHTNDVESLKHELRKVVANIALASKENDNTLVDKLMKRRADLKAALAKAQTMEQKRNSSDRSGSRGSVGRSSGSTPQHSISTSVTDPAGSFVKRLQAKTSSSSADTSKQHQSFAGYSSAPAAKPAPQAHSFAGQSPPSTSTPKHDASSGKARLPPSPILPAEPRPQIVESFHSNAGSSSSGSLSGNSLHDSSESTTFVMSETKVAQNALQAYKAELASIQHAMDKTSSERMMKKLVEQRADIKARIAETEEQLNPMPQPLPPLPMLQPEWDLAQVKKHTQSLQRELRDIVARFPSENADNPKPRVPETAVTRQYKTRRTELKVAIQAAFDRIAQLQEEATIRDIQIPVLTPHMDKDALMNHVDILKKELRQVVTTIAQTTAAGAKAKLKSQRSTLKYHLAMAQDQLAAALKAPPPPPAPSSSHASLTRAKSTVQDDIKMLESYIDTLKVDLKHVVGQITQTHDMPTINAMHLRRRNDLKKNLRTAQDQLLALQAQVENRSRSSTRSSEKGSSNLSMHSAEDDGPSLQLDAFMTTRMTQVYQNVTEKAGYLEWMPQTLKLFRGGKVMWVKLETSGCLVWYKNPSDTKVRGMVDLAPTTSRSVKVAYGDPNIVSISILSPGMLSNHEELMQFRATSEDEARGWVYLLQDTVDLLARQFPQQNGDELFGRNSIVY
ncbi:hypothetical protein H310_08275 [Aphanomyces invadans]|uniref:WW domain-containing protein n=1 Tax=Aphanomyces invadans TaxID=157072 RepID=A0A024TZM0_9STRA|nr:hypothetical protein H310_08275 [Aphanomyces invadans]ETV99625.1 hypothetical protein H310_08275 [Aphanomyces invadans]|eukprot:XP_008872181.1 hypothetical protein H310_08275 [Aphanomyces invadans]